MFAWINTNIAKSINQQKNNVSPQATRMLNPQVLPDNLAGRILDLQFQSQTQAINKQLVAQLTCLYIEAVEYHQARNNQKYLIYQKRKEHFLKKTAVQDILKGKSGELANKKQNTQKTIIQARNKSKSQVNKLLNQTEKRAKEHKTFINSNIDAQNKKLEQRIHRRKTMSNRSVNSDRDEFDNEEMGLGLGKEIDMQMMGALNSGRGKGGNQVKRVFI